MTTTTINPVNHRDEAIDRLEAGRQKFAHGDHPGAKANFKEAARLDPTNRQVWLCLASVSTGAERDGYLQQARSKHSRQNSNGKLIPGKRISPRILFSIAGVVLIASVIGLVIWFVPPAQSAVPPSESSDSGFSVVSADLGGNLSLQGNAGLIIPAGSLQKDEKFRLSYATHAPALPEKSLFKALGKPVMVETSATILRQPGLVGIRYDASQLPANTSENSLQVARWDGSTWKIVDRKIDLDQKIVYVPIYHFSDPVFQVIVWPATLGDSLLAQQLEAANQVFFRDESDPAAAELYAKMIGSFTKFTTPEQLANLSAADQQNYWMACNLWGDALYRGGKYDQAGNTYLACIQTALASGLSINWENQLFSGPGYALDALQNRYPLGVQLTQLLRSGDWAGSLPADVLTLTAQASTWQLNVPVELSQLPPAVVQSIEAYEGTLGRKPTDPAETSLDMLVLSPYSQAADETARTLQQAITPFLQSSGIAEIPGASLKDAAVGFGQLFGQFLKQNQISNRYMFDPVQSGEGLHTHAPIVLMRVERAWTGATGLVTHSQQIFTVNQAAAPVGEVLGEPIAEDATYQLTNGVLQVANLKDQWVKIGAALTKDIKTVRAYHSTSLAVGSSFACVLSRLNGVLCWGQNTSGQLGTGDTEGRFSPTDVKGLTAGIRQITAGEAHTCAIAADGKLWCWGSNSNGQVGNGSTNHQMEPTMIDGMQGMVAAVSAGLQHTCALTKDGKVYCWGNNASGELGTGNTDSSSRPVLVAGLSDVSAVSAGGAHTCALLKDGSVWCWGSNARGQLGTNSQMDSAVPVNVPGLSGLTSISAGQEHTCAITAAGGVTCWGANEAGQTGNGSTQAYLPAPAEVPVPGADVAAVKSLVSHTCAIKAVGAVCWGKNDSGQLGNGNQENQPTPVAIQSLGDKLVSIGTGSDFSCARTESGLVFCWGGNGYGQLGNGSTNASLLPTAVAGFGSLVADPGGAIEISPVSEDSIEMGSTIHIRTLHIPAGTQAVTYQLSYDGQPFSEIGRTQGADSAGVDWKSAGATLDKKVVIKSIITGEDGKSSEFTSRELTLRDTRKPSVSITIEPSGKLIAPGETIVIRASDPSDTTNGMTGSGVREIRFSVLQKGATIGVPVTLPYTPDQAMQVTWPAPLELNNSDTITFQLVVVDIAGNEAKVEDGGYSLSGQIRPNFIGDIQVKANPKINGSHIVMGSKVTLSVDLGDQVLESPQDSGTTVLNFTVSTNGGPYQGISYQSFPNGLKPGTVTSLPWDTGNPKIAVGTSVRFLVHIVDAAGKVTDKTSGVYKIDDTNEPEANKALTVVTSNQKGAPFLKLSANAITDGIGSGVARAEFKVLCNGVDLFKNAPIVLLDPPADIARTIDLPPQAPDEVCGYGKTLQVTLALTDHNSNVNQNAASGSATYLYDVTAPAISDIVVPAQIESSVAQAIKVVVDREPGGSRVKALTFTIQCDHSLVQEFPLQAQSPLSLEGEHIFSWTPAESSAACAWGKSQYTFSAWAVDENGNDNPPAKVFTKSAINYVDTKTPVVWINVNGIDRAVLPDPITQTLSIKINADDGPGGSGMDTATAGMKIYYSAGYSKSIDRYPNNGPYPCGPLKFVFTAKDNNFARNQKIGELVQYSNMTAQPLSGSLNFPDAINAYTVHISAMVKEVCGGIKNGTFQINYGTEHVFIPANKVQRNDDNATVSISADWTLARTDKDKYSGTSQQVQIKLTAVNNEDAPVAGSVDVNKTIAFKINDAPTNITLSSNSIAENMSSGSPVGTFSSIDPDMGDSFSYSLVTGTGSTDNAKFMLAGDKLQTTARYDYETKNSYSIRVRSTDSGGQHVDKAFTINVSDVNEAPVITSDGGGAAANMTVPENTTNPVTTVTATDPDAGAALAYTISGGADAVKFAIDGSTHRLTFVSPPDFEHPGDAGGNNVYDVTVQVSDGWLSDSQAIAVRISDVSDSPTITSNGGGDSASAAVAENSAGPITTITATDPIVSAVLTYTISGGADAARFALGSASHILTFVSSPDFENPTDANGDNIYHVIVSVSDGSVSDSQDIAVTVTNVNEGPQIISNANILVAENSTDPVTTVSVIDPDAGTNLTFTITGGADAAWFSIDFSSGLLSFKSPPDFETPKDSNGDNYYEVMVRVSDGSFSDSKAFIVLVTDVIEP